MLIIALRINESIKVGDAEFMITGMDVRGLKLRGGQVKLGIRPSHVRVTRMRKLKPKPRRAS
jgi:sRNA-binding carbon storage regulator CsrA